MNRKFDAAIFDLDGTLIDSMGVWARIDQKFLARHSITATMQLTEELSALSYKEAAALLKQKFNIPLSEEEMMKKWNVMAQEEYASVNLKPYAKTYLTALKEKGVKLAVATAAPQVLYEIALRGNGIYEFFDAICSTKDVARGKDYPDVYLYAAQKLGVEPHRCVVFEDIYPGIKSAKAAGMLAYGIYDEATKNHRPFIEQTADGFLQNFEHAPLP